MVLVVGIAVSSAATAQDQPAAAPVVKPEYLKLAEQEIADRLKLSDEQRAKVAELIKQRNEAVAKAEEKDRPTVIADSDAKLAAILTEQQRTEFAAGKPVPKLKFNFRFQRWSEVLQWFAEEADLSLVMDAPPPATFNYTDNKEYTPTEAIDLLNGVLLTKDFTLIRRGRMLVVVDMKEGIPPDLIPRIELKDLEQRGKHEFVTVMFPLGKRSVPEVDAEIKELLGPQGKSVPLIKTKQILVTATAGNMRAIGVVIESIPEPVAPPKPTPPPPPEKPVFQVHSVKSVDAVAAIEVLNQLVAGVKLVHDAKTNQINAYATPSQHAAIKSFLEKMEVENPPEKKPRLELYPLGRGDQSQLLATLQLAVPGAQIRINPTTNQLVAWGTPDDHAKFKSTIEKLGSRGQDNKTAQVEVYPLTKADPGSMREMLQNIAPEARITIDAANRSLIVLAIPDDQRVIKATLDQLQPKKAGPDSPQLQFYPFLTGIPAGLVEVINGLVPRALVRPDGRKLIVMATPADHKTIAATIQKFPTPPRPEGSHLEIYPVTAAQRKRFQAVLGSISGQLPGIRIITDAEPGELAVWTTARQHAALKGILEKLKRDVPAEEKYTLVGYLVKAEQQAQTLNLLQTMFPDARIISDAPGNRMLIWAGPKEHEKLKETLGKLLVEAPPESRPRFEAYAVYGADATALMPTLQTLVPKMLLSVDPKTTRLIAWGTSTEHEKLKAALAKVGGGTPQTTPQVEVYRLIKTDPSAAITLLQTLLPAAKITMDATTRSIIAVATPTEQQTIKATLEQLEPSGADPHERQLRFIKLPEKVPANLLTVLQQLTPQAQVTIDTEGKRLMVIATAADHAAVQSGVTSVLESAPAVEKATLETYPVTVAQRKRFQAVLSSVQNELPGMTMIADAEPGELSVWAKPAQHAVLAEILEKLRREVPEEERFTLIAYPLTGETAAQTQSLMQTLFPETRFIPDLPGKRLLAWARPADHEKLKESLDKLQAGDSPENQPRFQAYAVHGADATALMPTLQTLVPTMRLSVDPKTTRLIAWGTPGEHGKLKAALEQVGGGTPQTTPQVEVYRMAKSDPAAAQTLLQGLFPTARFSVDTLSRSLIVVAIPADQQGIRATLQQLQPGKHGPADRTLQFIPLEQEPPSSLIGVLQQLAPQSQVTFDAKDKRLMIIADAGDHEIIREAVKRVVVTSVPTEKNRLEIYPVTPAQRKRFQSILDSVQTELPGIRVITDAEPGELAIWAKPSQHTTLAEMIAKLKRETSATDKYELIAYPLRHADAANTLTVMESLFPGVKFVLDQKTKKLLVWAPLEQHKRIKDAVEKIDTSISAEMKETFHVYPIPDANPTSVISLLSELLPDAKFTHDSTAKAIIAWGRDADHQIIAATMKQVRAGLDPKRKPRLVIYPVGESNSATVMRGLRRLFPEARIDEDSTSNTIMAWATPDEHEEIRTAIEQIAQNATSRNIGEMVIYKVKREVATTAQQVLNLAVPRARLMTSGNPPSLIAWAKPSEHQEIAAIIKQIEKEAMPLEGHVMEVYEMDGVDVNAVMQLIDPVLRDGTQFIISTDRKRLIVNAKKLQQADLKTAIETAKAKLPKIEEPVMHVYRLQFASPNSVISIIRPLAPSAPMVPDMRERTLVITAVPKEHTKIAETLKTLDVERDGEDAPFLKSYQVKKADPGTVFGIVSQMLSGHAEIQLSFDSPNGTIIAFAYPSQHEKIVATIADIEKDIEGATPEVYRFSKADPNVAAGILRTLVPKARITVDNSNRSLVIDAIAADHEKIVATIALMDEGTGAVLKTYPLKMAEPGTLLGMLNTNFSRHPDIRMSADYKNETIIAMATPAQHEQIATFIAEVDQKGKVREPKIYHFRTIDPNPASGIISAMVPQARIAVDNRSRSLMIRATEEEHKIIAATIAKMDVETDGEDSVQLKAYPIKSAEPGTLLGMLNTNFSRQPEIRMSADYKNDTIIALATPAQHKKIAEFIAEVDQKGKVLIPRVYRFKTIDPNPASRIISTMVPKAQIAVDNRSRSLMIRATDEEHKTIAATIAQMDVETTDENDLQLKAYPIKSAEPGTLLSMLNTNFSRQPEIRMSVDSKNDTIIALATPAQHEKIAAFIAEVDQKGKVRIPRVYRFRTVAPGPASSIISTMVPKAQIAVDNRSRSLMIRATEEEHKTIAATIAQMNVETKDENGVELRSYVVKKAEPNNLLNMLQNNFARQPEVRMSLDSRNDTIVALATPEQHAKIQVFIENVEKNAQDRTSVVYRFRIADPDAARSILSGLAPKAIMAVDRGSRTLVVTATATEHEKIAATIKEMDNSEAEGLSSQLRSYPVQSADVRTLSQALQRVFRRRPGVEVSFDRENNSIVAVASAAEHEKIAAFIQDADKQGQKTISRVYRFENADPQAAFRILRTLTPRAEAAVDQNSRSLVVSATESDHAKIKTTVEAMDGDGANDFKPQLKVYSLKSADGSGLQSTLRSVFRRHNDVQISYDATNESIVALAPLKMQERIAQMIDDVEQVSGTDPRATLQVYRLKNLDVRTAMEILEEAVSQEVSKVKLSINRRTQQIVAIAGPEQHELIQRTIDQLDGDERVLEVFQLEVVEPFSAELSIDSLFGSGGFNNPHAPIVDSDTAMQQLFVRARREQLDEIRKLLVKMGETGLSATTGTGRRMRVIPFRGNTAAALREIRRVWPQLRKNSIQVVTPSSVMPNLRRQDSEKGAKDSQKKEDAQFAVPAEEVPNKKQEGVPGKKQTEKKPELNPAATKVVPQQPKKEQPPAPIIVAPSNGSITIASDDPEALDQFETLLRAMSSQKAGGRGENFIVFSLKNTSAIKTATTLQQLFGLKGRGRSSGRQSSGSMSIVADERLNSIIVHGNRSDRTAVEGLLQVLDAKEIPDSLTAYRPKLIPVKNADAFEIERVIRTIYKTALRAGGGALPITVPTGVSQEVAAAIQRVNAASTGPLLTVEVDDLSNTLVVMAPTTLVEEIEQLVAQMDKAAAGDSTRSLKVIQLKKLNSKTLRKSLNLLMNGKRGTRRRRNR